MSCNMLAFSLKFRLDLRKLVCQVSSVYLGQNRVVVFRLCF